MTLEFRLLEAHEEAFAVAEATATAEASDIGVVFGGIGQALSVAVADMICMPA